MFAATAAKIAKSFGNNRERSGSIGSFSSQNTRTTNLSDHTLAARTLGNASPGDNFNPDLPTPIRDQETSFIHGVGFDSDTSSIGSASSLAARSNIAPFTSGNIAQNTTPSFRSNGQNPPHWGSAVSSDSLMNGPTRNIGVGTESGTSTQTDPIPETAAKGKGNYVGAAATLGAFQLGSSAISASGGIIQTKMNQDFAKGMVNKSISSYTSAGLPSYLAFSGNGAAAALPKTTQMVGGSHAYHAQIPGNSQSSSFTGSTDQSSFGWGQVTT